MPRQPDESLAAGRSKESPRRCTLFHSRRFVMPIRRQIVADLSTHWLRMCRSLAADLPDRSATRYGSARLTWTVGVARVLSRRAQLIHRKTLQLKRFSKADANSRCLHERGPVVVARGRERVDHPPITPYNPRNRSATGNGPTHVVGQTSPGLRTVQLHNSPSSRWWWSTIRSSGCTIM